MLLITDRTQADVLLRNAKGTYNATDLNRVEQAVAELCSLAAQLDLYPNLVTKTDWAIPGPFSPDTWPTAAQMARYLNNVRALCDIFSLQPPLPQTMAYLTFQGANEIENALRCVLERMQSIIHTYQYSGEIYAGEENVI